MPEKINVLLGAGFSKDLNLPLTDDINSYFNRDLRGKLLKFSSGEWLWVDDKNQTILQNGHSPDRIGISYVFDEIKNEYKKQNGGEFCNYEDFYQFFLNKKENRNWFEKQYEKARIKFIKENNTDNEVYLNVFSSVEVDKVNRIINYLISDLVALPVKPKDKFSVYDPFITFIKEYEHVNIFSLNHDLVVEKLLKNRSLDFADGFTTNSSPLLYEGNPQKIFNNKFNDTGINLVKLHGSIDTFRFNCRKQEGAFLSKITDFYYYKSESHRAKHYTKRIDLSSGQTVQDYNDDITPQFITGTDKESLIENDYMYSAVFDYFADEMSSSADCLIDGYSYTDDHINEIICKISNNKGDEIININPHQMFPFEGDKVFNVSSLSEL